MNSNKEGINRNMEIRKVNLKTDLSDISLVYAKSWKHAYARIIPAQYLNELVGDKWISILSKSDREMLVLDNEGQSVGVVTFGVARDSEYSSEGELMSIYLLPEYIHKGYGTKLLKKAEIRLVELGYATIYLWVLAANNSGRNFYKQQGFHVAGNQREIEIGGSNLTEIRYIKNL
ncbi:GNAT family N-acetyltransferase [Paucilactobacillus hokkaidonensis]|nr:GNAT family N-acetyltransferase [Paucilactobacillus hokkaidonensis]